VLDSKLQQQEGLLGRWIPAAGLVKQILWQGTAVSLGPRSIDNYFDRTQDEAPQYTTQAMLGLPLRASVGGSPGAPRPGVVVLRNSTKGIAFSDRDQQLLQCVTGLLSSALEISQKEKGALWSLFGFSMNSESNSPE